MTPERAHLAKAASGAVGSLAELSRRLPIQAIDPSVHKLIEEGPIRRRRFLDWGVFHVEQSFLAQWQRFHRALRQRHAALRQAPDDAELDAWDRGLESAGLTISEARGDYVARYTASLGRDVSVAARIGCHGRVRAGWPGWSEHSTILVERRAVDRSTPFDNRRATSRGSP